MRALIMGGTAGIGLASAELLGDGGIEVTVTGRDPAKLDRVRGRLHAVREAQVTGSITMISASGARAAVPGTVALSAANGAIERSALAARGRARARPRQRGLPRHHRHRLVGVPRR